MTSGERRAGFADGGALCRGGSPRPPPQARSKPSAKAIARHATNGLYETRRRRPKKELQLELRPVTLKSTKSCGRVRARDDQQRPSRDGWSEGGARPFSAGRLSRPIDRAERSRKASA